MLLCCVQRNFVGMVSQDDYGTVILAGLLYNYVESRLGWPTASNSASMQVVQQSKDLSLSSMPIFGSFKVSMSMNWYRYDTFNFDRAS
jgi:hypothetical protein